jgi:hypothetical protein
VGKRKERTVSDPKTVIWTYLFLVGVAHPYLQHSTTPGIRSHGLFPWLANLDSETLGQQGGLLIGLYGLRMRCTTFCNSSRGVIACHE